MNVITNTLVIMSIFVKLITDPESIIKNMRKFAIIGPTI